MGDCNLEEDTHTLIGEEGEEGEEVIDGHDCWKVASVPVDPDNMTPARVFGFAKSPIWSSKLNVMITSFLRSLLIWAFWLPQVSLQRRWQAIYFAGVAKPL